MHRHAALDFVGLALTEGSYVVVEMHPKFLICVLMRKFLSVLAENLAEQFWEFDHVFDLLNNLCAYLH